MRARAWVGNPGTIMVFLIVRIEGIEGTAEPLIGLLTLLGLPRLSRGGHSAQRPAPSSGRPIVGGLVASCPEFLSPLLVDPQQNNTGKKTRS